MLRILDHVSAAGLDSAVNEDAWGAEARSAWVIDGATTILAPRMDPVSDARWHASALSHELHLRLASDGADPVEPLRGAIAAIAEQAGDRYDDRTPPSSSVAVVVVGEGDPPACRFAALGDIAILHVTAPGSAVQAVRPIRLSPAETRFIEESARLREGGLTRQEALDRVLGQVEERRTRVMNTDAGYWIAGLDPAAADHALRGSLDCAAGTRILLMSDGFAAGQRYAVVDDWATVVSGGVPLAEVLRQIRAVEEADADGTVYPRLKRSDDATAVLAEVVVAGGAPADGS